MISIRRIPLYWFVDKLETDSSFAFVRYGDGEFQAILNWTGQTSDGQRYGPALQQALAQTLLEPRPYHYAIGPIAIRSHGPDIETWLNTHQVQINWLDTETFALASVQGELAPLIQALDQHRVLYVGTRHLAGLSRAFRSFRFFECSGNNAFGQVEEIRKWIIERAKPSDVVGLSCGPAAKVLIHRLYPDLDCVTLIDFGSVFDPYFGMRSRSYMRRADWTLLTKQNFGKHL